MPTGATALAGVLLLLIYVLSWVFRKMKAELLGGIVAGMLLGPGLASTNYRSPSLLHRKTCGVRFILHVFEGPSTGGGALKHVKMILRPP